MKLGDFIPSGNLGRSTADQVSEILRQAVIGRVFEAGERLVESKIAADLQVSITPVRQAFTNLATEGLLTVFPYKGTYVTILTQEAIDDLAFVRKHIELLAMDRSFKNLKPEDSQKLMHFCELSDSHFQTGNLYLAIHYDRLFHEFFVSRSDSALLMEMWNLIKNRIEYSQTYTKYGARASDYAQRRHGDMIRAVERLDKEALMEAACSHMATAMQMCDFPRAAEIQYR